MRAYPYLLTLLLFCRALPIFNLFSRRTLNWLFLPLISQFYSDTNQIGVSLFLGGCVLCHLATQTRGKPSVSEHKRPSLTFVTGCYTRSNPSLNRWNTFNLPSIWYKTAICPLPHLLIFLPPLCRTVVLHHSSFLFFLNLAITAPHQWWTGGGKNKNSLQLYVDGIPRWNFVMFYLPKYKRGIQEGIFIYFYMDSPLSHWTIFFLWCKF